MPNPVDLKTFKPNTPKDLFDAIVSHVVPVLGDQVQKGLKELRSHIQAVSIQSFRTAKDLAEGKITQHDADYLLNMQEAYLNNILRLAGFLPYVLAQAVLDTVIKVISAAVKNWTGIELKF
jgi:hypothetical protein